MFCHSDRLGYISAPQDLQLTVYQLICRTFLVNKGSQVAPICCGQLFRQLVVWECKLARFSFSQSSISIALSSGEYVNIGHFFPLSSSLKREGFSSLGS